MLRTALRSVAEQTALAEIEHVFVSENLNDPASAEVCKEFPQLPITFLMRKPVSVPEHLKTLMEECLVSEYTAILFDDDWWMPQHLENALRSLTAEPETSMYAAGHLNVYSESSVLWCESNFSCWFAADFPTFKPYWKIDQLNIILGSIFGTPGAYSTFVARSEILKRCSSIYEMGDPFDNDRRLVSMMAGHKPILYNPTPLVFIRNHDGQDNARFNSEKVSKHMSDTTEWLVAQSGRSWFEIAERLAQRCLRCPPDSRLTMICAAQKVWCLALLVQHLQAHECVGDIRALLQLVFPEVFQRRSVPVSATAPVPAEMASAGF